MHKKSRIGFFRSNVADCGIGLKCSKCVEPYITGQLITDDELGDKTRSCQVVNVTTFHLENLPTAVNFYTWQPSTGRDSDPEFINKGSKRQK